MTGPGLGPERLPRAVLASALVLMWLGACTDPESTSGASSRLEWTSHHLPAHPGPEGRAVVRDAVHCGGRWFVAGGVVLDRAGEDSRSRPALWSSAGGDVWQPVAVRARTYWGERAILSSIACSRARIAAVGAQSGGAHGNPRVTTFFLDDAGTLRDVEAPFTQYGGTTAVNVGPVSGGTGGWLIAGNRLSGPAVWIARDPRSFELVEGEPGLTADRDLHALARGGGQVGGEWVLVGGGARTGAQLDRDPLAWTSPDGKTWRRQEVPATVESEDAHRVLPLGGGALLAVGTRGDRFASWVREGDRWRAAGEFGSFADRWRGAPGVASLAVAGTRAFGTVRTGATYELWSAREPFSTWTRIDVPLAPGAGGDHTLGVAAGDGLLLIADDGEEAHVWTSNGSDPQ